MTPPILICVTIDHAIFMNDDFLEQCKVGEESGSSISQPQRGEDV